MEKLTPCGCCPPDVECRWSSCAYCGGAGEFTDHVWPRFDGGVNDSWNTVRSCRPCNSSKGAKVLVVWLARVVMSDKDDARSARIIARLRDGSLTARLGPMMPEWIDGASPEEGRSEDPRSLMDWVTEYAIQDLHAACGSLSDVVGKLRSGFGEDVERWVRGVSVQYGLEVAE